LFAEGWLAPFLPARALSFGGGEISSPIPSQREILKVIDGQAKYNLTFSMDSFIYTQIG